MIVFQCPPMYEGADLPSADFCCVLLYFKFVISLNKTRIMPDDCVTLSSCKQTANQINLLICSLLC
jgi:hypothetical protein